MAYSKIRPKRGTATQWETANPVLAEGEIGIEAPENGVGRGASAVKVGDGLTSWNSLPYAIPKRNEYMYMAGDTINQFCWCGGAFITSGAAQIIFTPVFDKALSPDITKVEMTAEYVNVRTPNGYLWSGNDMPSTATLTFMRYGNSWRGMVVNSSAFSGATNNTPCGIDIRGTLNFS